MRFIKKIVGKIVDFFARIFNRVMNKIGIPVLLRLIVLALLAVGTQYSVHKLSDYMFNQIAKPFFQ